MNKRLLQIALVIVVIAIWSKLAFDFFEYKKEEPAYVVKNDGSHAEAVAETVSDFTYELNLNYTDPFFKKNRRKQSTNTTPRPPIKKIAEEIETPKEKIPWPKLRYLGDITNTNGGSKSIILKVEKEEYILHEGGIVQNVEVISIYRDSLIIAFMDEKKTIFR